MSRKKKRKIRGIPVYPLHVGSSAMIQMGDRVLQTSRIVNLQEGRKGIICFETRNTRNQLRQLKSTLGKGA